MARHPLLRIVSPPPSAGELRRRLRDLALPTVAADVRDGVARALGTLLRTEAAAGWDAFADAARRLQNVPALVFKADVDTDRAEALHAAVADGAYEWAGTAAWERDAVTAADGWVAFTRLWAESGGSMMFFKADFDAETLAERGWRCASRTATARAASRPGCGRGCRPAPWRCCTGCR